MVDSAHCVFLVAPRYGGALGVNQHLRFDVIATVPTAINQTIVNTATITAPVGITAVNTSNDNSSDSDPALNGTIDRDGFETHPSDRLTLPAAAEALR